MQLRSAWHAHHLYPESKLLCRLRDALPMKRGDACEGIVKPLVGVLMADCSWMCFVIFTSSFHAYSSDMALH